MNAKWCFSVLVAILTLFGVNQHQTSAPNQEIVVQFANVQINSDDAQKAITNVKLQLQLLGADNIQVREGLDGILKISYYIDSDVASIKKQLADNNAQLGFAHKSQGEKPLEFPINGESYAYNLDVFEIQTSFDTDLDLQGIAVVELKSENHRFFNPNGYASIQEIDQTESIVKIAFKVNTHIAIAIDNTSHKIPEVRAGPRC